MGLIQRVFNIVFFVYVFRLIVRVCLFMFKAVWFIIYWLCIYPLYLAFYIGLYPLIWLIRRVS
jgi:hypothetical protein